MKFSFIIPAYNASKYIEKCVNSILTQNYSKFEVIVIDDGSTDGTDKIIREFMIRDSRVSIYTKSNGGQASARNLGIRKAVGDYFIFVDSDDWLDPQYLSYVHASLSINPTDFLNVGFEFFDPNGRSVKRSRNFKDVVINGEVIFKKALIEDDIYTVVWNKVISRTLFLENKLEFADISPIEDVFFTRKLAFYSKKTSFLNSRLYFALSRPYSSSRVMDHATFERALELLKLENDFFESSLLDSDLKAYFDAHIVKFMSYLLIQGVFRIDNTALLKKCLLLVKRNKLYINAFNARSIQKLNFKNKLISLVARYPLLLRPLRNVFGYFGLKPY